MEQDQDKSPEEPVRPSIEVSFHARFAQEGPLYEITDTVQSWWIRGEDHITSLCVAATTGFDIRQLGLGWTGRLGWGIQSDIHHLD